MPFSDTSTLILDAPDARVRALLRISKESSLGVVVISGKLPALFPGRTRTCMNPRFTTSGGRVVEPPRSESPPPDPSPPESDVASSVPMRRVSAMTPPSMRRMPRRASRCAIISRSGLRIVGSPLPRR